MYKIIDTNNNLLSLEDKVRYVKMQPNGVIVLCSGSEAQGVVVNNDYAVNLDGRDPIPGIDTTVKIEEFSGVEMISELEAYHQAITEAIE